MTEELPSQPKVEWHLVRQLHLLGPLKTDHAYDVVAEALSISAEQRALTLQSDDDREENAWNNLCRFARRRLVDDGLMSVGPHGVWELTERGHQVAEHRGVEYQSLDLTPEDLGL